VTLSQDWGIIFHDRKPPCVWQVAIYAYAEDRPAWRIEPAGDGQCRELGTFRIGITPTGFRETVPLSGPPHGHYTLVVLGIGRGEATIHL